MFYQAVVAAQLLPGSETWVLPPLGLKYLAGFHSKATRRLTGIGRKGWGVNGCTSTPQMVKRWFVQALGLTIIQIVNLLWRNVIHAGYTHEAWS